MIDLEQIGYNVLQTDPNVTNLFKNRPAEIRKESGALLFEPHAGRFFFTFTGPESCSSPNRSPGNRAAAHCQNGWGPGSNPALEFMDEPRPLSMEASKLHLINRQKPPGPKAARMLPVNRRTLQALSQP